jgi:toxin ParE1/3/4
MGELRFSPAATRDLQKISDDIAAAAGARVALDFIGRLQRSLDTLAAQPRAGRTRVGLGPDVRSWAVWPYVALYRPNGPDAEIIRILHGRRRITRRLLRDDA